MQDLFAFVLFYFPRSSHDRGHYFLFSKKVIFHGGGKAKCTAPPPARRKIKAKKCSSASQWKEVDLKAWMFKKYSYSYKHVFYYGGVIAGSSRY